eukprot:Nk52_evm19s234 gene=Nk52_evmTU19s234
MLTVQRNVRSSSVVSYEIEATMRNKGELKQEKAEEGYFVSQEDAQSTVSSEAVLDNPTVWSRDYFGLLASYWCVGIFQGLSGLLYPLVIILNGKEPSFFNSASQLITIWWSYKFFYGFLTDFVPIFGFRRKVYIVVGHGIAIAICFIMAAVADSVSIEFILALMALQNFFSVFADVASDGFTVQMAQRETDDKRGKTQTYVYSTRFLANCFGYLAGGILLNGPTYHGEFDFELSESQIFLVFGAASAIAWPFLIFCLKEQRYEHYIGKEKSIFTHLCEVRDVLLSRPVYQFVGFYIINMTLSATYNGSSSNYANAVIGMTSLQNSLQSIFNQFLMIAGMMIIKTWFLNVGWRWMFAATMLLVIILSNVTFLFIWGVTHNSWLYILLNSAATIPNGMNFIVSSFFMVEIAKPGQEAVTYSILSTIHNLCIPLGTVISNQLMGAFPNLDNASIEKDDYDFRINWTYLTLVVTALNIISLVALPLFPNQKEQARLLLQKRSNRLVGWLLFVVSIILLLYSTTLIILNVVPSTQCLEIVGGGGC